MNLKALTPAIDAAINKHTFSGVVTITCKNPAEQNGAVVYEKAVGYAYRSNKIENTLATRFGIASGTKFFTALAIGKLIEAGKLSFSTKVAECISWNFPRYSKEITIQHLLTHTSGIPDYYDEEKITDFDNFTVAVPWSELLGLFAARLKPEAKAVGLRGQSPTGYAQHHFSPAREFFHLVREVINNVRP